MHDELTKVDIKKMQEEIEYRRNILAPKLREEVRQARELGDLSENFEYHAARREMNKNIGRINYLQRMIDTAVVIEPKSEENSVGLFDTVTLYVMPMVDPDGVDLVTGALPKDSAAYKTAVGYAGNYPQIPFPSGWKANLAGVDLNLNYPAMWERARELKFAAGYQKPGPRDYVGPKPLSEPESTAVFNFTQSRSFAAVLAFHTQGEVIYQGFERYLPPGSAALAARLARASGYAVENAPAYSGYAGYKDWFILAYNLPGYTVEVGQGVNPLPISSFNRFYPPAAALMAAALQGISAGEEAPESTE